MIQISIIQATQVDSTQNKKTVVQKTASSESAKPVTKNDTLVINARLIEIFSSFPSNDIYNYVYIMKYRVVSVIKGSYKDQEILVGHYNPRTPRNQIKDKMDPFVDGDVSSFTVGDKHKLILITPIDKVWTKEIEDSYQDLEMAEYFALRCDKIK